MTIRDRIFNKLTELNLTQKEFAKRTGIPETTVSDWKKKKTNPTAEKILIICKVLNVTPEWLLSGVETHGTRSNPATIIAVDTKTEKVIIEGLKTTRKGKTTILIAHRISTVEHMDKIIFIDDGKLLAVGTHEELINTCPDYAEMVRLQTLEEERGEKDA